jgi:hypothetical protein
VIAGGNRMTKHHACIAELFSLARTEFGFAKLVICPAFLHRCVSYPNIAGRISGISLMGR